MFIQIFKFFGHVIIRDSIEKNIIQLKVEGKRNRGRSLIHYINQIKALTQMSMLESIQNTENREFWRNVSNRNIILYESHDVRNLTTINKKKK
jgi:hypothetical protein